MHKSKLAGFIIDCNTGDLPGAAHFWGAALGMQVRALPGAEGEKYIQLVDPSDALHIEVQKVGAKRVQKVNTWWVMEAPTGQRFCIVRAKSEGFARKANSWK